MVSWWDLVQNRQRDRVFGTWPPAVAFSLTLPAASNAVVYQIDCEEEASLLTRVLMPLLTISRRAAGSLRTLLEKVATAGADAAGGGARQLPSVVNADGQPVPIVVLDDAERLRHALTYAVYRWCRLDSRRPAHQARKELPFTLTYALLKAAEHPQRWMHGVPLAAAAGPSGPRTRSAAAAEQPPWGRPRQEDVFVLQLLNGFSGHREAMAGLPTDGIQFPQAFPHPHMPHLARLALQHMQRHAHLGTDPLASAIALRQRPEQLVLTHLTLDWPAPAYSSSAAGAGLRAEGLYRLSLAEAAAAAGLHVSATVKGNAWVDHLLHHLPSTPQRLLQRLAAAEAAAAAAQPQQATEAAAEQPAAMQLQQLQQLRRQQAQQAAAVEALPSASLESAAVAAVREELQCELECGPIAAALDAPAASPAVPGALGYVFGWLSQPGEADRWWVLGSGDMAEHKVFEGAHAKAARRTCKRVGWESGHSAAVAREHRPVYPCALTAECRAVADAQNFAHPHLVSPCPTQFPSRRLWLQRLAQRHGPPLPAVGVQALAALARGAPGAAHAERRAHRGLPRRLSQRPEPAA